MYFQIKTTYNRPKLSYTSDLTTNSRVSSLANPSQHCLYLGLCHVISYWFILVSFKTLQSSYLQKTLVRNCVVTYFLKFCDAIVQF